MADRHDESKLPQWAQKLLSEERERSNELHSELQRTRQASVLLTGRQGWFTIPGPEFDGDEKSRGLWVIDRDGPWRLCDLGPGDVLLIGRAQRDE